MLDRIWQERLERIKMYEEMSARGLLLSIVWPHSHIVCSQKRGLLDSSLQFVAHICARLWQGHCGLPVCSFAIPTPCFTVW